MKHFARVSRLFLALLLVLPLAAAPPAKETIMVPMRDGVKLATDVFLPATNGVFPVLLARTPYNKDASGGVANDGTKRGYAVVIQDTRGRFASEGENLPFHLDTPDGADTLAWLAAQPWCSGRIGTFGGSAGAITQFQLAASGGDRLVAQHLVVGAPNLYEVVYTGGVFRKSLIEDWIRITRFASNALPRWVEHPVYDSYWKERDASRRYPTVRAAGVHVGGWWDIFAQPTIDAFAGYQVRGGARARHHQKLLMGPWTHGVLQEKAGELTFPNAKKPPGNVQDQWRWFDHWLRGTSNGVEQLPPVTYYVLGDVTDPHAPGNVWRTAAAWPPVKASPTKFYLHGDRTLSTARPPRRGPLSYTYDPAKPVPTIGGIQLTIPAGPMDQRGIESRDDVLVFTSDVLNAPLEVTGGVRARLWISSDAPDTDFFVRLCDVYPDGQSYNLCEGMLRTRFREGFDHEVKLAPGKIVALNVDCWSTSVIFNRGHRLRVHVTSSSAPGFDPNPNTGEPFRASDRVQVARNSIYVDPRHPSYVVLPVARK